MITHNLITDLRRLGTVSATRGAPSREETSLRKLSDYMGDLETWQQNSEKYDADSKTSPET